MSFEIEKCEGWGRLGNITGISKLKTPNIMKIRSFNNLIHHQDFVSSIPQENWNVLHSMFRTEADKEILEEKTKLESFPSCLIYPSLQMQGKSLTDVSCYEDWFPVEVIDSADSKITFHLIPWDLPTVSLGRFDQYLEKINNIDGSKFLKDTKFILNIPCSSEIFTDKLPILKSPAISAVCLGDISSLLTHPTLFIKYIVRIKSWISPNVMMYTPGVPSTYIPLLVYLGVDLFDLSYLKMFSSEIKSRSEIILEQNTTEESFIQKIILTRKALEIGKLRDLVRIFANAYPPLKTILRICDNHASLEGGTQLYGQKTLYCTDETDFTRPEVTRFRKRIHEHYFPSSNIAGVIFLPCSAKKPYSKSKSHHLFRNKIRRNLKTKRRSISEIILTSPLGVVPRELEYTFPAAHYDIPVTGKWSEIEKRHLKEDLDNFLSKLDPSLPLVGYVTGVEREILKKVCANHNRQISLLNVERGSLTSREALKDFSKMLRNTFASHSTNYSISSKLSFLRAVADFQFGYGSGSILLPDRVKIFGRKERGFRIQLDNNHLLTFRSDTGFLTLSIAAGKLLM
ncbi:MAG: DUF5591 domain-containing protein, partial [Candidatus Hodarchaeales archaeon]